MSSSAPSTNGNSSTVPAPAPSPTEKQLSFWQSTLNEHGNSLLRTMLLHSDEQEAADMNEGEVLEIFNMCKIQKTWVVCEWAAGMGRITPLLAQQARFVYASDFVSAFCDTNRARCEELGVNNVQVDCIDAATYAPTPEGTPPHKTNFFDLVFINWLLLYLDDAHAEQFLRAAVASLKQQLQHGADQSSGWIFLHESCWERVDESQRFAALPKEEQQRLLAEPCEIYDECKTYYRKVYWYRNLFDRLGLECTHETELSVYAPNTFSDPNTPPADAAHQAEIKIKDAAASSSDENAEDDGAYNRQMCWMLRIKQQ